MTEDTQVKDPKREELIAEMLRDSKTVELPSELTKEPVIHRGDEELPAPMVVSKVTSAGYRYVWDTRTFKKIPILYYMINQKMRQRRPDGSYQFQATDPHKEPKRGTLKCFLHKDDPSRKHYDELGFRTCKKENITNPYQVLQHMKSKHKAEWAAIEEERKERERQEDRQLQKLLLSKAAGEEKPPLYVSDKDKIK